MQRLPTSVTKAIPAQMPRQLVHWPRSAGRRVLFVGCYFVFLVAVLWAGYRLYWSWKLGVSLIGPIEVWDHYYPELRRSGVLTAKVRPDDEFLDVVMLGGSTLENSWGDIEALLKTGLQRELGDSHRVRVFNLAMVAHTSRDSVLKFSRIADKPFDLILIYDGFNDCRMNNCPREMFRDDYTHCVWYRSMEKRKKAGTVKLPAELLNDTSPSIVMNPDEQYLQFGGDLKTPGPFRHNLEEILALAKRHESLVVLQTFAYHIPPGYSDAKFKRGELNYSHQKGVNHCALELWGTAPNVVKCVDAHNQIIRELARTGPGHPVLVDQHGLIPHDGRHFIDPCHLTDAGCRKFVDNVLPAVVKRLRERTRAANTSSATPAVEQ